MPHCTDCKTERRWQFEPCPACGSANVTAPADASSAPTAEVGAHTTILVGARADSRPDAHVNATGRAIFDFVERVVALKPTPEKVEALIGVLQVPQNVVSLQQIEIALAEAGGAELSPALTVLRDLKLADWVYGIKVLAIVLGWLLPALTVISATHATVANAMIQLWIAKAEKQLADEEK